MRQKSNRIGFVLSPHPNPIDGVFPDISYVEKYVDIDSANGEHWFWRDGRSNHRHNRKGHALLSWSSKIRDRVGRPRRGEYCVARLLIAHRIGPIEPYTRFESLCGLCQCVNPTHWRRIVPPPIWTFSFLSGGYWSITKFRGGAALSQERIINVLYGGDIHAVHAVPGVHNPDTALTALCGTVIHPMMCAVTRGGVTCTKGC